MCDDLSLTPTLALPLTRLYDDLSLTLTVTLPLARLYDDLSLTLTVTLTLARLYDDLSRLGFGDDIDHVEIGRTCKREMRLRRSLDKLMVIEA